MTKMQQAVKDANSAARHFKRYAAIKAELTRAFDRMAAATPAAASAAETEYRAVLDRMRAFTALGNR